MVGTLFEIPGRRSIEEEEWRQTTRVGKHAPRHHCSSFQAVDVRASLWQTCIRDIKLETETETETVGFETETETETVGSETETRHQARDSSRQFKTSEMHIGPKARNIFSQLLKSNTRVNSLKSADHLNCINYKEIKYFSHSEIF